jgi:thioredoxin 1
MTLNLTTILAAGCAVMLSLSCGRAQTRDEISPEKILSTGPEWQEKYNAFQPEADMIEALKSKLDGQTKIEVYLGLWCKDSRNNVPLFLKIMSRAGGAATVRYFDLPRKENKDIRYFVEEWKVEKVPTFIIFRDGKEIGRIIENPKTGILEDLMEIVFNPAP